MSLAALYVLSQLRIVPVKDPESMGGVLRNIESSKTSNNFGVGHPYSGNDIFK